MAKCRSMHVMISFSNQDHQIDPLYTVVAVAIVQTHSASEGQSSHPVWIRN